MAVISSYTFNASEIEQTHAHEHGHIIIVLYKEFTIQFSGKSITITPDNICFVPPGVEHTYSCTGIALTMNIPASMIKVSDLKLLSENCLLPINEKLAPLVELIKTELETSKENNDSMRYLFYYLYDKFVCHFQQPSVIYIEQHYAENISIAELAELENYSLSYFCDSFKKRTGVTPGEYIKMVRMDKAKEILATTRYRIIDVALQVGYSDGSAFTRAFKEVTGMTPICYRKQIREGKGKE